MTSVPFPALRIVPPLPLTATPNCTVSPSGTLTVSVKGPSTGSRNPMLQSYAPDDLYTPRNAKLS